MSEDIFVGEGLCVTSYSRGSKGQGLQFTPTGASTYACLSRAEVKALEQVIFEWLQKNPDKS